MTRTKLHEQATDTDGVVATCQPTPHKKAVGAVVAQRRLPNMTHKHLCISLNGSHAAVHLTMVGKRPKILTRNQERKKQNHGSGTFSLPPSTTNSVDVLLPWMYKPELYTSCAAWFSGRYVSVPATADRTPRGLLSKIGGHFYLILEGSSITMNA